MLMNRYVGLCDNLPQLESSLLWTMRAWVLGHCRRRDVSDSIQGVFDHLRASEACFHLDHFMQALSRGANRSLEVNCVCNSMFSEDEAALIDIFALQQREQHEEAFEKLTRITTEFAAMAGCDHANRVAIALSDSGHFFNGATVAASPGRRWQAVSVSPSSLAIH